MNRHPSRDALEKLARDVADDPRPTEAHVATCPECGELLREYREEDAVLRGALAAADAQPTAAFLDRIHAVRSAPPRGDGLRQAAVAAVVLAVLLLSLFAPARSAHRVVDGTVTLGNGKRLGPSSTFDPVPVQALETTTDRATLRFAGGARVDLFPSTRIELQEIGEPMNALIITVLAGSLSLQGGVDLAPGRSAFIAPGRAPVVLEPDGEDLKKRLEALAAEIGRLEAEVQKLEKESRDLRAERQALEEGRPAALPGQKPGSWGWEK